MRILFVLIVLLCFGSFAGAQFIVPTNQGYVSDYAQVLSSEQEDTIRQRIAAIQESTHAQIAVLLVTGIANDDIAFAATQVGQEWGVGDAQQDNGVVILIAVEDRQWFIAVGYGLEGVLPDAIVKRMGEHRFPDAFRQGQYAEGILAVLDDMQGYIVKEPTALELYDNASLQEWNFDNPTMPIFFAIGFLLAIRTGKKRSMRKKFAASGIWLGLVVLLSFVLSFLLALFVVSFIGLFFLPRSGGGLFLFPGGGFGRGGMGGSGGSFGGFGGGSFGGGGAGGRR